MVTQQERALAAAPLPAREEGGYRRFRFEAMGTECQIEFRGLSEAGAARFRVAVQKWVADFEAKYSRFRPESMIGAINRAAGGDAVATDRDLEGMLDLCEWFYRRTRGVFDPTTLPLTRLWDPFRPNPRVPDPEEIGRAMEASGWEKVERGPGWVRLPREGMAMDLGGIGKEYAVDRVSEMARRQGASGLLVDFGRDLRVAGESPAGGPWRIGLEHPYDPGRCWGGVAVADRAVATSGDYIRCFEEGGQRFGHVIDPRTGHPTRNGCTAVSVIAATCTEAGVLAKCALILGPDEGLDLLEESPHVEGVLWANKRRYETRRFHAYAI